MFTTGLLDTVAAKCPSGICRAEGVVIRPVVPKSDALAVLTVNANKIKATIKAKLLLAKKINAFPISNVIYKAANAALKQSLPLDP